MFQPGLFKGKRILVTGGGTGLGREMADKYLELGADIYICGRRKEMLDQTAKELMQKRGGSVKTRAVDIRDAEAVDKMIAWIIRRNRTSFPLIAQRRRTATLLTRSSASP